MVNALFKSMPEDFGSVGENFDAAFDASVVKISRDDDGGESLEYYNPMKRKNLSSQVYRAKAEKSALAKASIDTQTGGAGTAGTALIPIYPDPKFVDRTIRETPLRNMIPRRAVRGLTYDYIPKTSQAAAVFAYENATIADQVDVYDRVSVGIKFLYAKGRVSGPSIDAMRGFVDPTQLDLASKTKAIREAEEEAIINGDASTNPEEFTGLITGITTNTTNMSGNYVELADLRSEMTTTFNANGDVTVAVTDKATHNYIKGLLLDIQRNVENPSMDMMGFGIPGAFDFDGVMFIADKFMPTGASSKRILFLDMRYIFMAVLREMTYEEKYDESDRYPFLLKEYLTLVLTFEASSSQIYGIA